jgi:hypothetical protein
LAQILEVVGHTGLIDTGLVDTGLVDTGLVDTGLADTGLGHTGLVYTGLGRSDWENTEPVHWDIGFEVVGYIEPHNRLPCQLSQGAVLE